MRRFLLLYILRGEISLAQHFAEGLFHYDGTVYVRGFPDDSAGCFANLADLKGYFRDHDDILTYHIVMIDKEVN